MKDNKCYIVIHIKRGNSLKSDEINFLSQLFRLKTSDQFNINRLLIDLSFQTFIKRSFGTKPHELLIFYETPIKVKSLENGFVRIINSIDNKTAYDKLKKDEKFFIIGNSAIARLDSKTAKKINKLIICSQFVTARPTKDNKLISAKQRKLCNHYINFDEDKTHEQ